MQLFNDQIEFSNAIVRKIAGGVRKLACQLCTGGGKTVIFSDLAKRYYAKYRKSVLIFVHREELQRQTRETLYDFGITGLPIVAGMRYIPPAEVYVGMIESTFRRLSKLNNIGLVIIDEAHIGVFNKLHTEFPDCIFLGFTATPITASRRKPMSLYYDDIVCGAPISELIKLGRLSQNVTYAPKDAVDRAALVMKGDEFDEVQMGRTYSKAKFVYNTIQRYEQWGLGKKTIIYNCNTTHNLVVNDAFIAAGYDAKTLDSVNTPKHDRKAILDWFEHTPNAILNNVGIATLGFDEPTIETVIVNRATASMPLWIQMGGRGSRITDYKSMFTIVDMGCNAIAHGDWCQDRDWNSLFWHPPKPGKGGVPPFKICPACEAVIFAGLRYCPLCGAEQRRGAVPVEVLMSEFVVVTKDIDVAKLVELHSAKKQYYPFFLLSRMVADSAFKTTQIITDEIAMFALSTFNTLAKAWAKCANRTYSHSLKIRGQEILFKELKKLYPEWDCKILTENGDTYQFDKPIR